MKKCYYLPILTIMIFSAFSCFVRGEGLGEFLDGIKDKTYKKTSTLYPQFQVDKKYVVHYRTDLAIPIYQIGVEEQGWSYCGYHALKNLIFAKQFVSNFSVDFIKENFQDNLGFIKFWSRWEPILKNSQEPYLDSTVSFWFEQTEGQSRDKGVLLDGFVPVILSKAEGDVYRGVIDAFTFVRSDLLTNPFDHKNEIQLVAIKPFKAINDAVNKINGDKQNYYGLAFAKNPRHWVAMSLIKSSKKKKVVLCFDSLGNQQLTLHPIVIFITEAFSGSEQNAFAKKYFKLVIPEITQRLEILVKNTKQDEIIELMTDKDVLETIKLSLRDAILKKAFFETFDDEVLRKFFTSIEKILEYFDALKNKDESVRKRLLEKFQDMHHNQDWTWVEFGLRQRTYQELIDIKNIIAKHLSTKSNKLKEKSKTLVSALQKFRNALSSLSSVLKKARGMLVASD